MKVSRESIIIRRVAKQNVFIKVQIIWIKKNNNNNTFLCHNVQGFKFMALEVL